MIESMPAEDMEYDYIAGVSIGAINASILALYPTGELKEGVRVLREDFYQKYTTGEMIDFYDPWFIAPFTHKSFASNEKLMKIVNEKLEGKPFQRKLSILAADLKNA